jgi:tRNA (guanine-N7-)-methyltransferase
MKPQDLVIPCSWQERCPMLFKKFFYIPIQYSGYENFKLPLWSEIFANDYPICVEYCSGNGQWIIEKAIQNPQMNWIAVEKKFERARKIWVKAQNNGLNNIFIVFGEAEVFTKYYLSSDIITSCHINFPDPWPKRRHKQNRLIKREFLEDLSRVMMINGKVTITSDDELCLTNILQEFDISGHWQNTTNGLQLIEDLEAFGLSYFAVLWRNKGRQLKYLTFMKLTCHS